MRIGFESGWGRQLERCIRGGVSALLTNTHKLCGAVAGRRSVPRWPRTHRQNAFGLEVRSRGLACSCNARLSAAMKPFGNRRALASALLREARRQKHLAWPIFPRSACSIRTAASCGCCGENSRLRCPRPGPGNLRGTIKASGRILALLPNAPRLHGCAKGGCKPLTILTDTLRRSTPGRTATRHRVLLPRR